ncbi:glycine betaine/proline transport system ATP-binding protein [Tistlia consotensis]|uniref:Trimethylamine N-oxide transport system ATP-binding protein TmoW n=1 Tax=Tistlia consotensis USBA 355 TaxID=560819 RepID=A0A1Y6CBR5_9PROT|nr:choline ABC transporter ATP-binding protein [Tistlia consotensis]SMF53875.1 glycine betaine/proline transport system ATP-binding protein [Tistlia consotensis USBA 355]SNR86173.1 glycine betaine/proline transport system ATP-binding protein [Tistlia consotensis]
MARANGSAADRPVVTFEQVDIVFGEHPKSALPLIDAGKTRSEILEATGNVLGVAGASLAIRKGEICVLMGLSGSGKSTLLRAVNGLNPVTRGRVLVEHDGRQVDVASCDAQTLRALRTARIAMVFQQFALLPWRTVTENVGFGLELRGLGKAERDRIVADKLKLVGLGEWGGKYAHELSGGMQQRVGLARAFATDADILLMDEPFSALDPLIRDKLQDELLELQRALNKTILFVSHDLDEAMKLGNRIAIMEGGRIVQVGTPEEIVLDPANDYVAEFVAHMNPLRVLRGGSLMTPLAELRKDGSALLLDREGRLRLELDAEGRPSRVTGDGAAGRLVALGEDFERADLPEGAFVVAPLDLSMRAAIELRQATGHPVILTEGGRAVGVCGDEEIYRGILRQSAHEPAAHEPAAHEPAA